MMFGKITALMRIQVDDFGTVGRLGGLRELRGDDALVVGEADGLEEEDQVHLCLDFDHSGIYSVS